MNILNLVNNRVENYTIILSNRGFQHYGQLTGIKFEDTNGSFNLNSANELSFKVYKHKLIPDENIPYKDIETFQEYIWQKLVDRKLIYVKELDEYYEIKISIDDANETIKTVQATTLCESELSQLNLYNIEINTADDRANNGETIFYNPENQSVSLLHRILKDKAPHYTIKHVDASLCNLARTFTLSGTSIYDFMVGECSEQFDCLFKFNSKERGIYVYDMLTVCKYCGERGDFTDKCPKCESRNLKRFGNDTPIYVDKTNLTDAIHLEVDSDSIKNCFKLEAGDEEMTSIVRSLNPNGTDYYFLISDADKADMPEELKQKLNNYDKDYQDALPTYQDLTLQISNLVDDKLYYEHSMMPTVEYPDELADVLDPKEGVLYICNDIVYVYDGEKLTPSSQDAKFYTDLFPTSSMITAKSEADKLTMENLNPFAVSNLTSETLLSTVNTTLKNYAKVYIKTGYVKLEIDEGATFEFSETNGLGTWNGRFKVTSYSNEEDIAYSEYLTLEVNDNQGEQMNQKVLKSISENDEENSIFDVLAIDDLDVFREALGLYSLSRLESFREAIDSAKITLSKSGQGTEGAELYKPLYLPYQNKLIECDNEINVRQTKIDSLKSQLDTLIQQQSDIQTFLNLQNYLGDLYPILCSYRREDTYSNSNFISVGLDNAQKIERAKQFCELAQKEIKKASNGQCTITAPLYNLLAIPAFKPLVEYFELGNRIRVKVDGILYVLMLIGFSLNFGDLNTIEVTFSTATKTSNEQTKEDDILESAKQMSTSYDYVQKQAKKAKEIDTTMKSIVQNGLDSSLVTIKNNENEEVTQGKFGILLREKDDITGGYFGKQCRLTHNSMIYTEDNWETAKCALGEHRYTYYNPETNTKEEATGYGLTADFVQAGTSMFSPQIIAGDFYSEDYDKDNGIGSHIDLNGEGEFQFGRNLLFDGKNLFIKGNISGSTFEQTDGNFSIDDQGIIAGKSLSIEDEISTQTLNVDTINNGQYPKTLISTPTLYVNANTGDDENECVNGSVFKTLQGAINSIPKFMNGRTVYIELQTNVVENVTIRQFVSGIISIYLAGHTVYGYLYVYDSNHINIYGGTKSGGGQDVYGTVHPPNGLSTNSYASSVVYTNSNGYVYYLKIYGGDTPASGVVGTCALHVQAFSKVYASYIAITNVYCGFRAQTLGHLHVNASSGVGSKYGFTAVSGSTLTLASNAQSGGNEENIYSGGAGEIRYGNSTVFETGSQTSSSNKADTTKVTKTATYASDKGNAIQYYGTSSAKWRSDNTPKQGSWGYGAHAAWWFFGDDFENIASKDVTKVQITFTRNSGGNHGDVTHKFYVHSYEKQPSDTSPSYNSTCIGTVEVPINESGTITITNSDFIKLIKAGKGICAIPKSQSKEYYSVMSGTMKVKFTYKE